MLRGLPLVVVVAAALSAPVAVPASAAAVVSDTAVTTSAVAPTSARRPAGLAGEYRRATTGVRVTVTCPCRRVTVTYRANGPRIHRTTIRVRSGTGQVLLPTHARRIRALTTATGNRRAGRIVVREAPAVPTRPTPDPRPQPRPQVSPTPNPSPTTSPSPRATADPAKVFRMVVIPDTQMETKSRPDLFNGRMTWIADNSAALRIRHVIQVGDLVDTDNCGVGAFVLVADDPQRPQCNETMRANKVFYPITGRSSHYQYANASSGLDILDEAGVPYTLAVGNHDTAAVCGGPACVGRNADWGVPGGTTTYSLLRTTTTWDATFPPARFPGATLYEPGTTANLYRTFSAGGLDWMVVSLELWPRTEVIQWASQAIAAHPNHNVIITTHHYLNPDGQISPFQDGYGSTTPQYLWDHLVKLHANIRFVFSGHAGAPGSRLDVGVHGNRIQSMVTCYHDSSNAQTMLLTINPDADTADAVTYVNPGSNTTVPQAAVSMTDMDWVRPDAQP